MTANDDSADGIKRRDVLKTTGLAAAGAGAFAGAASARGQGKGNSQGKGEGNGGGPPFLEPTWDGVVFCGCSQVCVCELPEFCNVAKVVLASGRKVEINEGECYSDGKIIGVEDDSTFICNPNLACSGNDPEDCDLVGTAPQFGAKCGDAFLAECDNS